MEGTPNCKEQNRETNHTNQALKATKKQIVSRQVLPVSSLETKVGRYEYLLLECVRVERSISRCPRSRRRVQIRMMRLRVLLAVAWR